MLYLVNFGGDDFGVYSTIRRNHYGTGLMFRGSLAEAIDYRKAHENA